MTLAVVESASEQGQKSAPRGRSEPILIELWAIKRRLNEQVHYDVAELARQANAFDIDLAMKQLGVAKTALVS